MLFVELRFLLFLLLVFAVYWTLRGRFIRKLWLLAVSYGFYATFEVRFLALVAFSTLLDYAIGLALGRTEAPARRRMLVTASLVVNLGILAYFKYADFFIASAASLLERLGFEPSWQTLNIVLPVGISFYTFQTLSYTIDVYRRKLEPTRNLLDVALFVGFFPQLAAGPIVRATHFLPQTRRDHRLSDVAIRSALVLLLVGYVQKAVVADNLAPIVDSFYADPGAYSTASAWLATLLFWVQVYGDFAGYSCMAIGMAALLGYHLPVNFDFPFIRTNVAEFWARWHMTLSAWINDYVLRPLRKPGQSWARHCANIVFAMALFGLWHGAAWKFVLWGAFNGIAIVVYRTARKYLRGRTPFANMPGYSLAALATTLAAVTITVPLFRAEATETAFSVMKAMIVPSGGAELTAFSGRLGAVGITLLLLGLLAIHYVGFRTGRGWTERVPAPAFAVAYGLAIPIAFALSATALQPYIYFRF